MSETLRSFCVCQDFHDAIETTLVNTQCPVTCRAVRSLCGGPTITRAPGKGLERRRREGVKPKGLNLFWRFPKQLHNPFSPPNPPSESACKLDQAMLKRKRFPVECKVFDWIKVLQVWRVSFGGGEWMEGRAPREALPPPGL